MGLDERSIPGDLTHSGLVGVESCCSGLLSKSGHGVRRCLFPVLSPSRIESKDMATSRSEVRYS
jgi:hypothetical protein